MRNHLSLILAAGIVALAAGAPVSAQPYGYGMMGGGYGPGGYGMMGPGGYGPNCGGCPGPGDGNGYGPGWMMGPGMMGGGYGPGWGMQRGYGPGMMGYGPYGNRGDLNISTDDAKSFFERQISNPRLKVGTVTEKDADTIVVDIVTKDKEALVQRFAVNRHNGYFQPEQ